jgi:hypothetical protein
LRRNGRRAGVERLERDEAGDREGERVLDGAEDRIREAGAVGEAAAEAVHSERAPERGSSREETADRPCADPADGAARGEPTAETDGFGPTWRARMLVCGKLARRREDDREAKQAGLGPPVAEGDRRRRDERPHATGQAEADSRGQAPAGSWTFACHPAHYPTSEGRETHRRS